MFALMAAIACQGERGPAGALVSQAQLVLLESLATQMLVDLKDQLAHRETLVLTARTELPKLVGSQSSRLLVLLQDQQKSQLVALLSPSSVVDLAKASRFL
jgi:hypothetical protein